MTARPMPFLIALALAVSLTVMTVAAAVARGQTVAAGGQVLVLCSAGGPVQVTLDASGAPTGKTHLCPDLAVGLLAALHLAAPDVAAPGVVLSEALRPARLAGHPDRADAAPQARGPPLPV